MSDRSVAGSPRKTSGPYTAACRAPRLLKVKHCASPPPSWLWIRTGAAHGVLQCELFCVDGVAGIESGFQKWGLLRLKVVRGAVAAESRCGRGQCKKAGLLRWDDFRRAAFGQPKVEQLDRSIVAANGVVRFDVAVQNAPPVRCGKTVR